MRPALFLTVVLAGCGTHQSAPPEPAAAEEPASPEARISITYSHPGDHLQSMVVTKYGGAQTLRTGETSQGSASVVRFDGGVVVWEFAAPEKGLVQDLPLLGHKHEPPLAPQQVKYGTLPAGFVQSTPDSGPPEPLQANQYYVFTVIRSSGSMSYEAVKVNGDGSLEAFAAEPRAGNSFRLCCNVPADFPSS
ncbi:MAG TPA: hypothetical protein VFB15_12550 [Candidatus Binataceae bacterium]|nr:hypothetical protein [Candidatus Binataceae bacterium]